MLAWLGFFFFLPSQTHARAHTYIYFVKLSKLSSYQKLNLEPLANWISAQTYDKEHELPFRL